MNGGGHGGGDPGELLAGFRLENGIHVATAACAPDPYRQIWEEEATHDAIYSATGVRGKDAEDFESLTMPRQPLWQTFPKRHFSAIAEIGCGYGRVPMILSHCNSVTCDSYTGIDISLAMLERFAANRQRFGVFSGSRFRLVCASANEVPLAENSLDLVISSAVFLHMGRSFVDSTLQMIGRALRPGGMVVFDSSFANRMAIASLPVRLFGIFAPSKANRAKYYSKADIRAIMDTSGLAAKAGPLVIDYSTFALVPGAFRGKPIPFAAAINRLAQPGFGMPDTFTGQIASVYSTRLQQSIPSPSNSRQSREDAVAPPD